MNLGVADIVLPHFSVHVLQRNVIGNDNDQKLQMWSR